MRKHKYMTSGITAISAFLFIALIDGAIVGLYFLQSNHGRLILLSLVTGVFAVSFAMLTTARRQDVYGATAA